MSGLATPTSHGSERSSKRTPEEVAEALADDELRAVAALQGIPRAVAEAIANGWGRGTRIWASAYGLVEQDRYDELKLTPFGLAVISAAAERCPDPYGHVSLDEVTSQARASIANAIGHEPRTAAARTTSPLRPTLAERANALGFAAVDHIARAAESVGHLVARR